MKERTVRINQQALDRTNVDRFALQVLAKKLQVKYEYLVDGLWVSGPPSQRPEGKRVVFEGADNPNFQGIERYRAARDTYLAWQYISDASEYDPVNKEAIIERLLQMRTYWQVDIGKYGLDRLDWKFLSPIPLRLFTPWGVRVKGQFGKPEIAVLDRLKLLEAELRKRGIPSNVLLMPADLYATEVNRQVKPEAAATYFATVTNAAEERGFLVRPWSQLRTSFVWESLTYTKRTAELTREEIDRLLGKNVVNEAVKAARNRSGYRMEDDVEAAAYVYLRERIFEAEKIERDFKPIKVSAVAKNKDNGVDRDLPRIYIIPPELQFPWLK